MADALLTWGWQGLALLVFLALSVGSFLNVVIYRFPVMLERQWQSQAREVLEQPPVAGERFNLVVPRSRCPQCEAPIGPTQNVPVLSWVLLKGRCHNCAAAIPARYPIVELLTAMLTVAVVAKFGYTWLGAAIIAYTWALIALTFIDYDTQLLPDQITLPLVWLGLTINMFGGLVDLPSAVIGAMMGYLFLWATYWGFKLITGKEGMGYGDFKLFAAIGAWVGWQLLPAAILVACVAGLAYALASSLTGKRESAQPIPFGPFLAVAGWVAVLARDTLLAWFLPS